MLPAMASLVSNSTSFSVYALPSIFSPPKSARRLSNLTSTSNHISVTQETRYGIPLNSRLWRLCSIESALTAVALAEEEKKAWEDSRQLVSAINFSEKEADAILGKAFGWVNSTYWGEERDKEVPVCESLNLTLDYLRTLGLSDEDLNKVLKKFPEVLGCDLENEVKANIAILEKDWGIKGTSLRNLLLRNPKILGYNVDCKGDCIAKCTRCWVRF